MELHGKEEQFDEKHMRYSFISQSITCLYIFAEFGNVGNGSVNCRFKRLHRKQTHAIVVRGY